MGGTYGRNVRCLGSDEHCLWQKDSVALIAWQGMEMALEGAALAQRWKNQQAKGAAEGG